MGKKRSCLIEKLTGHPRHPHAFETSSFLVSMAIGFLYHAAQALNDGKERMKATHSVTEINSRDPDNQNAAGKLVWA